MKSHFLRLIILKSTILLAFLTIFLVPTQISASTLINNSLSQLDPNTSWPSFFTTNNGQSSNTINFGAYVFHAVGDTVYIGLANYRPADAGSALLAKYNGTTTSSLGILNEEGVNEIVSYNNTVFVGGVDPHDSWALGNVYTYNGTTFTKIRAGNGLTNVIHMWGIDVSSNGTLYAAVSSHDGSFPGTCNNGVTCFGEVFKSTNNGQTWSSLGHLGLYRVFDIKIFSNKLYALYVNDVTADDNLAVSTDDGASWTTLKSDGELRRTHLTEFDNKLVMLGGGYSANVIYAVDSSNTITSYSLPFSVGISHSDATYFSNYNQFVVASDNYLYAISNAGDVWRTHNLSDWSKVADTSYDFIAIGYWANQNKLLLSSRGASANIYTINLNSNFGAYISTLSSDLNLTDTTTNTNAEASSSNITSANRTLRLSNNTDGLLISDVVVDMTEVRDWGNVTAKSERDNGRSYVKNLVSAPGASTTHTLYIPIPETSSATSVRICPYATDINQVTADCADGVNFAENETKMVGSSSVTVTRVAISGINYWKASNVSGTGGIDTSNRTGGSSSTTTTTANLLANQAGTIWKGAIKTIVSERTVPFDFSLTINTIPLIGTNRIGNYWQISDSYDSWFTSFFNGARVIKPLKKSTISVAIPTSHQLSIYKNLKYTLAHSKDMKVWRIIPNTIINTEKTMLSTVDYIGGYYAVVAQVKSSKSRSKVHHIN